MAAIETLTGVTKISDQRYEVDSDVVVGANIDDLEFAHFSITTGALRFGAGCTTTFTRCHFEETDNAISYSFDNFNNDNCRFHGGATNTTIFQGCVWTVANGLSRYDFDVRKNDTEVTFKDFGGARTQINIYQSNVPHFAGTDFVIDGLIMNNEGSPKGFELAVPPANISNLEVIDNHPGNGTAHVTFLTGQWASNDTYSIRGLKARNLGTYQGNATMTVKLIDPYGDLRKSNFLNAGVEIHRTYKLAVIDSSQVPVSATQIITFTDDNSVVLDAVGTSLSTELLQDTVAGGGTTIVTRNSYRRAVVKYGYLASISALLVTAQDAVAIDDGNILMLIDSDITETNEATVLAYSLTTWNSAQMYDAIKVYEATRSERHLVGDSLVDRTGIVNDLGSLDLVFDNGASSNVGVLGSVLTVKGTTYDGSLTTTGSVTLDSISESQTIKDASTVTLTNYPTVFTADATVVNVDSSLDVTDWTFINSASLRLTADATITTGGNTGLVIDANGFTLTRIDTLPTEVNFTNLTNQNVSVYRNGVLFASTVSQSGSYQVNIATTDFGETFTYKIRKYGEVSTEGAIVTQQTNNILYIPTSDTSITEATVATVIAYATIDNPDELYDYLRYYSTTVAGMAKGVIGSSVGDTLDLTGFNLNVDATAGIVFDSTGTTITIKSTTFIEGV